MNRSIRLIALVTLPLALGCGAEEPAPDAAAPLEPTEAAAPPPASRVDVAMSAAPAALSADATIADYGESGELVELRAGTNGWLCLPDQNPTAEGDSPICIDPTWQTWFAAYQAREEPQISGLGVSYMLQGGPAPSNTDPFAETPPPGEDWLDDGPHLMLIVPDPAMLDAFPTEHTRDEPYVMWAGTPYAHLMVPVAGG